MAVAGAARQVERRDAAFRAFRLAGVQRGGAAPAAPMWWSMPRRVSMAFSSLARRSTGSSDEHKTIGRRLPRQIPVSTNESLFYAAVRPMAIDETFV